jgi:predicted phosphodiesterase
MLRKLFRIQYTSDLHLEMYNTLPDFSTFLKPCAPYLALAGDIGHPAQLRDLFAWAAPQWKRIFYIAGNHEYYGAKYEERQKELEELAAPYTNLHFLHAGNPSFYCEEENVAVIGATLWTSVSKTSNWRIVNDYGRIRFSMRPDYAGAKGKGHTFMHLNLQHETERALLDAEITAWSLRGAQICVMTHHMPSFRLIHPRFAMSSVNDCFASHSDVLIRPPVKLWIYGHTHACSHNVLGKIPCVVNAKGYLDEEVAGWRADVWMEFPTADPQVVEAAMKRKETPLHLEEEELTFV